MRGWGVRGVGGEGGVKVENCLQGLHSFQIAIVISGYNRLSKTQSAKITSRFWNSYSVKLRVAIIFHQYDTTL